MNPTPDDGAQAPISDEDRKIIAECEHPEVRVDRFMLGNGMVKSSHVFCRFCQRDLTAALKAIDARLTAETAARKAAEKELADRIAYHPNEADRINFAQWQQAQNERDAHADAIIADGFSRSAKPGDGWIASTTALPAPRVPVLACAPWDKEPVRAQMLPDGKWNECTEYTGVCGDAVLDSYDINVTHWRPIPAPPPTQADAGEGAAGVEG